MMKKCISILIILRLVLLFCGTGTGTGTAEGRRQEGMHGELIRKARSLVLSQTVTTPERVTSEGYPSETHRVTTVDGYILELHRIPRGLSTEGKSPLRNGTGPRPPVLLMHCVLCSSIDWILNYPDKALGFVLADHGYDVWMANARGSFYSKRHVFLSTKQRKFWDFSWQEIAKYDMPAIIDHMLEETGDTQISYVGYSMGSALLYAFLSENPQYNQQIRVAAILGPAAYLTHSQGTMFTFSSQVKLIETLADMLGIWEVRPQGQAMNLLASTLCSENNQVLRPLCLTVFSNFMQIDEEISNLELLPLILSHILLGGSMKTITHFMQVKNADRFQKYDYGAERNLLKYGTRKVPAYHINQTVIPVGLFSSLGDKYVRPQDVNRLAKELPNVVENHRIMNNKFSHFDFLWARDNTKTLYKRVLRHLDKYL